MTLSVTISRKSVMGLVEGISVTISQHNGGTPSFEQLWASDSESPKLDIYYREAISDLEKALSHYVVTSTAMFDLQALGSDYVLQLKLADTWSDKLTGVLKNKIQDYLVHAVTAGWLNDFDGLTIKQDYQAISTQDIEDIKYLCRQKAFSFTEHQRTGDSASDTDGNEPSAGSREQDVSKAPPDVPVEAGTRTTDNAKTKEDTSAGSREQDVSKAPPDVPVEAGTRTTDNAKTKEDTSAGSREQDVSKAVGGTEQATGTRHEDNSIVDLRKDWTNWSGACGFLFHHRRFKDNQK
nr:hypothetical protein [uncultured Prevotella sp.]